MRHTRTANWTVVFLTVVFCPQLHATTIIALINRDRILVGADSKVRSLAAGKISETTGCKIRKTGKIFFAYGGLMRMAGFDVPELVSEAFREGQDIKASLSELESLVTKALSKSLTGKEGRHSSIFIFGFGGRTFLHERRFVPTFTNGKTTVKIERLDCRSDCPSIAAFAVTNAPKDFVQTAPFFWKENGDVAFLKQLIAEDIKAAPQDSGFPIDILHVSSKGAEWIEKKPECG